MLELIIFLCIVIPAFFVSVIWFGIIQPARDDKRMENMSLGELYHYKYYKMPSLRKIRQMK